MPDMANQIGDLTLISSEPDICKVQGVQWNYYLKLKPKDLAKTEYLVFSPVADKTMDLHKYSSRWPNIDS